MSPEIVLLVCCTLIGVGTVPLNDFFPFGSAENDILFPPNDDASTSALLLPNVFPYFDNDHYNIYLGNNGLFSFLAPINQYVPVPFPLSDGRRLIAGFWSDIDTRGNITSGNEVYYQIYDSSRSNSSVFSKSASYIRQYFPTEPVFHPKMVITGTWYRVGAYSHKTDRLNTFQIVLVTDEIRSFAFLLYHELQWTNPSYSLNGTNSGTTAGQAGFNAGDGVVFEMLPYSRTDDIHLLANTSNVNVPGLFVFRIDKESVVVGGCGNSSDASFRPRRGSQLGLTAVTVQGPCFTNLTNEQVRCRFGESIIVNAIVIDDYQAICLSPTVQTPTRMFVYLSVDQGQTFELLPGSFTFTPAEYGVSMQETTTVGILYLNDMIVSIQQQLTLAWYISLTNIDQWPTETIRLRIETCRVYLNETIQGLMIDQCRTLISGLHPQMGLQSADIFIPSINEQDLSVIFFRIIAYDTVTNQIYAGYHSTLLVLRDTRAVAAQFCNIWANEQPHPSTWNESLYPCPRNIHQARVARCCYEPDPLCREGNQVSITNCLYHQGRSHINTNEESAVACYLSKQVNQNDSGTECCYDTVGDLILRGTGAGSNDRYRPSSKPVLHFFSDILSYFACCLLNPSEETCGTYFRYRPSQEGADSPHPSIATWGDPHFRTLDGSDYTFNGYGEYTYLAISNDSIPIGSSFDQLQQNLLFDAQIRITPLPSFNSSATVIRGLAARSNDPLGETISVTISKRERIIVRRGNETLDLESLDDPENSIHTNHTLIFSFPEIVLERNRTTGALTFSWTIGVTIQLTPIIVHSNSTETLVFSIDLSLSTVYFNRTLGLLGSYDRNSNNDFRARNGSIINHADSFDMEKIHRNFGQTWMIDPQYSLFFYERDSSAQFYQNESLTFTPIFSLPDLPNDQYNRTIHACHIDPTSTNQSQWTFAQRTCFFDIAITDDISFGQISEQIVQKLDQIKIDQQISSPFNLDLPTIQYIRCPGEVLLPFKVLNTNMSQVTYHLVHGPQRASIDKVTGIFSWFTASPMWDDVLVIVAAHDEYSRVISKREITLRMIDQYRCVSASSTLMKMTSTIWNLVFTNLLLLVGVYAFLHSNI